MLSIIVTAVALFAFGALWYTVLFGKLWVKLMDFSPEQMAKGKSEGMAKPMVINFVLNLITAKVVYFLFPVLLAVSFGEFLMTVLVIWLGFSFPIYANQALWEKKSWKVVLLNSVQGILYFTLASAIIFYMR